MGRYDLQFDAGIPDGNWEDTGRSAWEGVHALLEIVEQDGVLRAFVTPDPFVTVDWYVGPDAGATVSVEPDGRVVLDFGVTIDDFGDAYGDGPVARYDEPPRLEGAEGTSSSYIVGYHNGDTLGTLEFAVAGGNICGVATGWILRGTSGGWECDTLRYSDFFQPVTVAIDQTSPQLRVRAVEALLPGTVLPFESLEIQGTEIGDLASVLDSVQFSDEAATGDGATATRRIADSPPTYVFEDWSAVSGTNQLLQVTTPLVDASGNQSGIDQQVLPVLDVGPALALHDFADSGSFAVWGPTRLLSAATAPSGLCDAGGCVELGPYIDFEAGFPSVAGRLQTSGATLVRIRYRMFANLGAPEETDPEVSLRLYSHDGSVEQLRFERVGGAAWTDPEYDWLTVATDWTWQDVPIDGSQPELGFVITNELARGDFCELGAVRVVIDEIRVE